MSLEVAIVDTLQIRRHHLRRDLTEWLHRTEPDRRLAKHHTQIARLHSLLTTALDDVAGPTLDDGLTGTAGGSGFDPLDELRRNLGTVGLLWDYFRDKLSQRDTLSMADHLDASDELAWALYTPVRDAAVAAGTVAEDAKKEPPLVFFSTQRAPFAQARTKALHPPGVDAKDLEFVMAELQRMPVPVIGLPMRSTGQLPASVLVGHEVGHVIAEDLDLAGELAEVVADLTLRDPDADRRRTVWAAWIDEVFADIVGVVSLGTAYVDRLALELAGEPTEIRTARIDVTRPGDYPPPTLRMAVCESALAAAGIDPTPDWADVYGRLISDSASYGDDGGLVAEAVLDRQWRALGGRTLPELIPWTAADDAAAVAVADAKLTRRLSNHDYDVRRWVAASAHAARRDRDTYLARNLDRALIEEIRAERATGQRDAHRRRSALERPDPMTPLAAETQDHQAGRALADRLKQWTKGQQ